MSTESIVRLLEEAAEMIDEWEGTLIAKTIQSDLDRQDYEALYQHVKEARVESFELNYHPDAL